MRKLEEILDFGNISIEDLLIANNDKLKDLGFDSNNNVFSKKVNNVFEPIIIRKDVDTLENDIYLTFKKSLSIIEVIKYVQKIYEYFEKETHSIEYFRELLDKKLEKNDLFINEKYNLGIHISLFNESEIRISLNENY